MAIYPKSAGDELLWGRAFAIWDGYLQTQLLVRITQGSEKNPLHQYRVSTISFPGTVFRSSGLGIDLPGFYSGLHHTEADRWTSSLTSPRLSFLIFKWGLVGLPPGPNGTRDMSSVMT